MKFPRHRMPRSVFEALARGEGGAEAVRDLVAAQHSKHFILLRGVREAARADDRFAAAGYELLAEVQRRDQAAAEFVVSYPSVGAWGLRTLRGDRALHGAEPALMAAVGAAAAIRAGLPARIEVPVTGGQVVLPSVGAAAVDSRTAVVHTSPAQILSGGRRVAVAADAPGWQGLRRVEAGSLRVLIDDIDPFRMPTADDLTARLTDAEVAARGAMLRDAWPMISPTAAGEITEAVRVIVPYATPPGGHVSSSAPENFGAVAMSRQPDRYTCAATLVHEVQHLKLSALLDLVTLTLPDDGRRYYAPWRTDPRPAASLLQGAYAFLGVGGFWRRLREITDGTDRQRADTEFARWREGTDRAVRTLRSSGRLTAPGQDFVQEMARVLHEWQREPVAAEAVAIARREAELHLARWQADNGELPT
jgi:uncharacterized protein